MSIHLAAATLSLHVPEQVVATPHPDCVTALRAAAAELFGVPHHPALPLPDLTLLQT